MTIVGSILIVLVSSSFFLDFPFEARVYIFAFRPKMSWTSGRPKPRLWTVFLSWHHVLLHTNPLSFLSKTLTYNSRGRKNTIVHWRGTNCYIYRIIYHLSLQQVFRNYISSNNVNSKYIMLHGDRKPFGSQEYYRQEMIKTTKVVKERRINQNNEERSRAHLNFGRDVL